MAGPSCVNEVPGNIHVNERRGETARRCLRRRLRVGSERAACAGAASCTGRHSAKVAFTLDTEARCLLPFYTEMPSLLPYPHPMSTLDPPVGESAGISSDRSVSEVWSHELNAYAKGPTPSPRSHPPRLRRLAPLSELSGGACLYRAVPYSGHSCPPRFLPGTCVQVPWLGW